MSVGPLRERRVAAALVAMVILGCASEADLEQQYARGIKAARADEWKQAVPDLESFTASACRAPKPSSHCREAYLALGRGYERRGTPADAWVAFDNALALPPHARDAGVHADLDRARQEIADQKTDGNLGPVIIRYRDEVTDEYVPRSVTVTLDFEPVYTKDKGAAELRSPELIKIYGGLVSAGPHVLTIEADHRCKPTEGVRCAASLAHRSWTFQSQAKHPVTLEVRAYAEPGEGDAPARPTIEMKVE
jgi:hypothetical protein